MKIFLCYTTRDNQITVKFLREIESNLKNSFDVYIDLIHNDSSKKQERVISELKHSDMILIIETPETYKSEWVKVEIATAKRQGTKIINFKYNHIKSMLQKNRLIETISQRKAS